MTAMRRALTVAIGIGLIAGLVTAPAHAEGPPAPVGDATAVVETPPVLTPGDAADDPAIWVHPTNPGQSVVIGNDKGGSLEVYDLDGNLIQRITEDLFFGNVDVRQQVRVGEGLTDVVGTIRGGVRLYTIDPSTRTLSNITDSASGSIPTGFGGEGFCLYHNPTSEELSAFVIDRWGEVGQFVVEDSDDDGLFETRLVRSWDMGSESEGCVVDDELGQLYISEEAVGVWKYGAEPGDPSGPGDRVLVDSVDTAGGHLAEDVEGLTIVYQNDGQGYLIASAQVPSNTNNYYVVYDRAGDNEYVRDFKVVTGPDVDGCGRTDGIAAVASPLGPRFPYGLFVCQDNQNTLPGNEGNQNFKFVPLERVVALGDPPPPPPPPVPSDLAFVGAGSDVRNWTRVEPAAAPDTQPGDLLLLAVSANKSSVILTAPSGWTRLGEVADDSLQTVLWTRIASPGDAGQSVTVTSSEQAKLNGQLLTYSGVDPTNPIHDLTMAGESVSSTTHTTPSADAPDGGWVVSGWADRTSSTTGWTPPAELALRQQVLQDGGGRVTTLTADSAGPVSAGPTPPYTATADSPSNKATTWTLTLNPATSGPPPARPPSAVIAPPLCIDLSCSFDGSGSTDPDDGIASYTWDLGDGAAASGPVVDHTYSAGDYTVTLTVTDSSGQSDQATVVVGVTDPPPPPPPPVPSDLAFVGAGSDVRNWTRVEPAAAPDTQPGDLLLLAVSANKSSVILTAPSGWTRLGEVADDSLQTVLWTRIASPGDAGQSVTVTSSEQAKLNGQMLTYSGVDPTNPIHDLTMAGESVSSTTHTTPSADAPDGGWVVSGWADRTSSTTGWTPPAELALRQQVLQDGGGRVTTLTADSAGPVSAGPTPPYTATADSPSNKATTWTLTLNPATSGTT